MATTTHRADLIFSTDTAFETMENHASKIWQTLEAVPFGNPAMALNGTNIHVMTDFTGEQEGKDLATTVLNSFKFVITLLDSLEKENIGNFELTIPNA